ncbi:MAG TPA: DUF192 domain-containing protein, partial [Oligoflexia bacterium]|nr:DUF192 domain-containing protein [Oligoflexia bacterium]
MASQLRSRFTALYSIALLPWSSILLELDYHQAIKPLKDGVKIEVAVGHSCAEPHRKFTATVARSKEARSKGLSGRTKPLSANEAMLFVFVPAGNYYGVELTFTNPIA